MHDPMLHSCDRCHAALLESLTLLRGCVNPSTKPPLGWPAWNPSHSILDTSIVSTSVPCSRLESLPGFKNDMYVGSPHCSCSAAVGGSIEILRRTRPRPTRIRSQAGSSRSRMAISSSSMGQYLIALMDPREGKTKHSTIDMNHWKRIRFFFLL